MPRPHTRSSLCFSLALAAALLAPTVARAGIPHLETEGPALPRRTRFLGELRYGQTSPPVKYNKKPRFRAYSFRGNVGDWIEIWVRSDDGDAVVWVTDDKFTVVAAGDDDDEDTSDAHLLFQLQEGGLHHVFFRDIDFAAATFLVALTAIPMQPPACPPGQRWDAAAARCAEDRIACGGIAGRPCPDGLDCVDDPRDGCDPLRGGRDCGGICVAAPSRPPQPCRPTACQAWQRFDIAGCRCIDNPRCGGIAARPCPAGYQCMDDPRDNCDPRYGGRDCGGVCIATMAQPPPACRVGPCQLLQHWDMAGCRCVDNQRCGGIGGAPCAPGYHCIDDPRDDCDPRHGGRDCIGTCM